MKSYQCLRTKVGLIGKTNIFNHPLYQIHIVVVASVHVSYRYCGTTNMELYHAIEARRRQQLDMIGVILAPVTVLPARQRTL